MEKFHEMKIPPNTPIISHSQFSFPLTLFYHKCTLSLWTFLFWMQSSAEAYNHITKQLLFPLLLEAVHQWLLDYKDL